MKGIYQVEGKVIFHDPGPEMIKVFSEIDPYYRVQSVQPGRGFTPKFQRLREEKVRTSKPLLDMSEEGLVAVLRGRQDANLGFDAEFVYPALEVLHVLTLNTLNHCQLCGWNCEVSRYRAMGKCGLRDKAVHSRPFIHIAEEPVINPSVVTNFGGCALRCIYCIEHSLWDTAGLPRSDPKAFWEEVSRLLGQSVPVNSLEFTNPTESLPGLIALLAQAPSDFSLPVVLNCHLYGSRLFYDMAGWITDVWLIDLRYGNDKCAKALSGVEDYMKYARVGLEAIQKQDSKLIVRILVLPGHVSCCHEPAMEFLSDYREKVWVSVLDQYVPEHKAHLDPYLKRRPTREEISQVEALVDHFGLQNIASSGTDFWRD